MNEPDSTFDQERTPDLQTAQSTDGLVRFFGNERASFATGPLPSRSRCWS